MTHPSKPVSLSRFRADLSRALSLKGRTLLATDHLENVVPHIEPLELYFLVKEIGIADALPVLKHTQPEQFQLFIDLDCWQNDRPDPRKIDTWLSPFADDGVEALVQAFLELEVELQILFLSASIHVYENEEDIIPPQNVHLPRIETPDRFFVIDFAGAETFRINVLHLLQYMYGVDASLVFALLKATKNEFQSELEENALGFRYGRMADLGFPSPEKALELFSPLPPYQVPSQQIINVQPIPISLPALYAGPLQNSSLLNMALSQIQDMATLKTIEYNLVYLINTAIMAYGSPPQDSNDVIAIVERVRDTLSLGIEQCLHEQTTTDSKNHIIKGDRTIQSKSSTLLENRVQSPSPSHCEQIIRTWPLRELFRKGYSEVQSLQNACKLMAQDPLMQHWLKQPETEQDDYYPDRMDRLFVKALLLPRALHSGFDPLAPERKQAFSSHAQLVEAEKRFDQIVERIVR